MKRNVSPILEEISNFFSYKIQYPIKKLFNFLCRLFDFIPTIWQDADYDCELTVYRLLLTKIRRVRKHIKSHDILLHTNKYCKQMRVCELLLERLISEEYDHWRIKEHEKKWGKLKSKTVPIDGKTCSYIIYREKTISNKDKHQERKEHLRIMRVIKSQREYEKEYLFKMLQKHMSNWWD